MYSETMTAHTFQLIEGVFTPEEALEIVDYILTKKINFHVKRDFQSQVTMGTPDDAAVKRIAELREVQAKVKSLLQEETENDQKLQLSATVSIAPVYQTETV